MIAPAALVPPFRDKVLMRTDDESAAMEKSNHCTSVSLANVPIKLSLAAAAAD
jgi:hypothetical protein